MKIFISHSSKNANYGQALVKLLTGIGVAHSDIVFTSDTSYGIPSGANIFDWLKSKISEKPFVIYLLSNDYYSSVACLNEMGAAWIIENEHVVMFTPDFDIESAHFRSGALDPREMGFRFNDDDRVTAFIDQIKERFGLSTRSIITNRIQAAFLEEVASFTSLSSEKNTSSASLIKRPNQRRTAKPSVNRITQMSRQNDMGPKKNEFLGYRIDNVDPIQMTNVQSGARVQRGKNRAILREMACKLGLPESGAKTCYSPNGDEFTTHDYARAILKELNQSL